MNDATRSEMSEWLRKSQHEGTDLFDILLQLRVRLREEDFHAMPVMTLVHEALGLQVPQLREIGDWVKGIYSDEQLRRELRPSDPV
jgi:hypothetical protein